MPVFIVQEQVDKQGLFKLNDQDFKHLTKVLRHQVGDLFEVLLPTGLRARAVLQGKGKKYFGKIEFIYEQKSTPRLPLWLGVGMIRWPRLEWLVEKATELGVRRLTPIRFKHSRFPSEKNISQLKINRLDKISKETLKQCARPEAPQIDAPIDFEDWLKELRSQKGEGPIQKMILHEKISQPLLAPSLLSRDHEYIFLIGPEGGFSPHEIELAEREGFQSVSLGPVILRTETAAIYGACVVHLLFGREI
jgi:16S rRNA (uracil1498-N3)-methyltransferase